MAFIKRETDFSSSRQNKIKSSAKHEGFRFSVFSAAMPRKFRVGLGLVKTQECKTEHPLTKTKWYKLATLCSKLSEI